MQVGSGAILEPTASTPGQVIANYEYNCSTAGLATTTGGGALGCSASVTGITIDGVTPTTMGYVDPTSSIQTQLNGKQASGSYLTAVTVDAPLSGSGTSGSHLSMHVADASDNGYLSSADWSTFNGKQAALTNPVTGPASPTAGYLTKWGPSGDAIVDGVKLGTMTDTDWCTFTTANGLQCTSAAPGGSGLSGMTSGQVAIAGSATTITSSKALAGSGAAIVTGPASSTTNDVAGFTGASGQIQDLGFLYTAYPAADIAAGALANGMTATTQTLGDNTTKLATDAFVIANAGSGCGNALTMNNGGSGAASGSTFNCGAAVTLSYNTIGASPALGNNVGETVGWTLATNTVYRFTGSGASNATTPVSISAGFITSIQNAGTAAVTVVTGGPTLHCEPSSCVVQIGGSALVTTDANGTDFDEIASNANGSAFGSLANSSTINNSNWSGTVLGSRQRRHWHSQHRDSDARFQQSELGFTWHRYCQEHDYDRRNLRCGSGRCVGLWSGSCSSSTYLRGDGACATPGGSGTVTSVATPGPITGGTITGSGTIACATCVTSPHR